MFLTKWSKTGFSLRMLLAIVVLTTANISMSGPGDIVINEIMYHPGDTNTGGEFIELLNRGDVEVDLGGWSFTEGISYTFPSPALIKAGSFVVICADLNSAKAFYSLTSAFGPFLSGQLDNGGEKLTLVDRSLQVIDSITYDDISPWPTIPDGLGPSLELFDPSSDNNIAYYWSVGQPYSPGAPNLSAPIAEGNVAINEIMYAPLRQELRRDIARYCQEVLFYEEGDAPELEYVELFNRGNSTADLSGWSFVDGIDYTFGDGILLAPGGYLLVASSTQSLEIRYGVSGAVGNFQGRLSDRGERITLVDKTLHLVDTVRYNDRPPWPVGPDQFGLSLECINPLLGNDTPANWRATGALLPPARPGASKSLLIKEETTGSVLIEVGENWRYMLGTELDDTTVDSGAWRQTNFIDTSWHLGCTGIGYGDGDDFSIIPDGTLSVFARKAFYIENPLSISSLYLEVTYDDGFVAYLNGTEITSQNILHRPVLRNDIADSGIEPILSKYDLSQSDLALVIAGTNELAIETHNRSADSSDLSFIPRLVSGNPPAATPTITPTPTFTLTPTNTPTPLTQVGGGSPGVQNPVYSVHLPPLVEDPMHTPRKPHSSDSVIVTATVTGIAEPLTVCVIWSLLDGSTGTIPMYDDGNHGDGGIGDNVFGATLPPRSSQTVVRYRIQATDSLSQTTIYPYDSDPSPHLAYFSYNGEYEGGPEEAYFVFVSQAGLDFLNNNRDDKIDVDATFVNDWIVYDHIGARYRGRGSLYASNNWKFSFNPGEHFKDLSTLDTIRHAAGIQLAAFRAFQLCGYENLHAFLIRFIENGVRDSALSVAFESPNGSWLDKHDLTTDGASIYKANSCDCISQGKPDANLDIITQIGYTYTDIYTPRLHELDPPNDLIDFIFNLNTLTGDPLLNYVQTHVDLESWFRRWAMQALLSACDFTCQNYYIFYTPEDPRWRPLAYDFDYAWGHCPESSVVSWPPLMGAEGEPRTYGTSANRLMTIVKGDSTLTVQYYSILEDLLNTCWTEDIMYPLLDEVALETGTVMSAEKSYVTARRNYLLDYLQVPRPTPTITFTPAPTPTQPPIFPRYITLASGTAKGFPDAVISDIDHDGLIEWAYVERGVQGNLVTGKYADHPPSSYDQESIPLASLGGATEPGFLLEGDQNGDGKNDLMIFARYGGSTTGMRLIQRDTSPLGEGTISNYVFEIAGSLTAYDADCGKAFSEGGTKTSLGVWYEGENESFWWRSSTDPIGTGSSAWCRLEFDNAGSGCTRAVGALGDFNGDGYTDAVRAYETCNNEVGVRFSNAPLSCSAGLHTLPGLDRIAYSLGQFIPRTCRFSQGDVGIPSHQNILTFANESTLWMSSFDAGLYGSSFYSEDGNPNASEAIFINSHGTLNVNNPSVVRIVDLDGDGIQEVLLGRYDGQLYAYYRFNRDTALGSGIWNSIDLLASYENASAAPVSGLSIADLDDDDRVEILVSNDFPDATGNASLTESVVLIDGLETIPFSGGLDFMEITPSATPTSTPSTTSTVTMTPTEPPSSMNSWDYY